VQSPVIGYKDGADRNTNFSNFKNRTGDIPFAEFMGKPSYMMDPFYKLHKYDPNSPLKNKLGTQGQILNPKSIFNQVAPQSNISSGLVGAVNSTMFSAVNSAMAAINNSISRPQIPLGIISVDVLGFGNSAAGGYVLYPSKPNNNMAQAVYRK
jgi:hypothetical protein